MDTITSARDLFTDYRLRHPRRTIALAITAVLGVLTAWHISRHRHRPMPLWFRALVVWPVMFTLGLCLVCIVLAAAGVYLAPRGYRWARAKWEARR